MFLWHYPHGFPHWELPSKPDHVGARTFLKKVLFCFQRAEVRLKPLLGQGEEVSWAVAEIAAIVDVLRTP
jgi:hypothetical protein